MTTQQHGSGSGIGGGTTAFSQSINDTLQEVCRTPTDYQNFFQEVVRRAQQTGVTEQQLLDIVNRNYSGDSSGSSR